MLVLIPAKGVKSIQSMQEAMNRLHTFCTDNKLAVNVGKTKSVKFRRVGGGGD